MLRESYRAKEMEQRLLGDETCSGKVTEQNSRKRIARRHTLKK
jgi:hypothetical protein